MKRKLKNVMCAGLAACVFLAGCSQGGEKPETKPQVAKTEPAEVSGESKSGYDAGETIKIGGGYQLSGQYVSQGDIIGESARLAIEEINAAGGVLRKKFELIEEDAGETTQDTVTATTKLLERGDITAVLGCLSSSYNIAVSGIISEYQVPFFAMGSSANVWKENNEYIWQIRVTDNYGAKVMAKAAAENLEMKKPGLLYCTNSFGQGMADGIRTSLKEDYNLEPAGEVTFAVGETNFSALLTQMLATGCDGIISISDGDESSLIMKQVYSMGVDLPCIGSAAYGTSTNMENAGFDAAAGWYTVSDWSPDIDSAESKRFLEGWNKMYPDQSPLQQNLYAYDTIYLLKEAIEVAGTADPVKVNQALGQVKDYQGAMSLYAPDQNRSFATTQFLCVNNQDGTVSTVESLKFR